VSTPLSDHELPAGAEVSSQCGVSWSPSESQLAVPSSCTVAPTAERWSAPASAPGVALPPLERSVARRSAFLRRFFDLDLDHHHDHVDRPDGGAGGDAGGDADGDQSSGDERGSAAEKTGG